MKKKDTINREQFYIDVISPIMNILQVVGNLLGYKHTIKIKAILSEVNKDENNPIFGKTHTEKTRIKFRKAKAGKNYPLFSISFSAETKMKISISKGILIFVYNNKELTLINIFSSANKVGEYFNVSYHTILRYCLDGKIFKGK